MLIVRARPQVKDGRYLADVTVHFDHVSLWTGRIDADDTESDWPALLRQIADAAQGEIDADAA